MTELAAAWDKWGWLGFAIYVLLVQIWPWARDRVYPDKIKTKVAERERLIKLEERQARCFEATTNAVEELVKSSIQTNERLASIITEQNAHQQEFSAHHTAMMNSLALLRERAARKGKQSRQTRA